MNNSMPIWGADNLLIVNSAYNSGSRALRLTLQDKLPRVEEVWYSKRMRVMNIDTSVPAPSYRSTRHLRVP